MLPEDERGEREREKKKRERGRKRRERKRAREDSISLSEGARAILGIGCVIRRAPDCASSLAHPRNTSFR